jgi:hypothetical protein
MSHEVLRSSVLTTDADSLMPDTVCIIPALQEAEIELQPLSSKMAQNKRD